ncbi:hypothetical protein APHAL10511_004206 [Amanita phalloides]|nr:hypothetical protein APHAL10511_004206 [Amanita phalloides]
MFSLFLREKLYIGEACWAFIFGVIIGPYGADIFNPRSWGGGSDVVLNQITLEFTRVVLAIGVFAIGVELPKAYMARHWKSLFFLLVPVMTWGWFVSAGLIYALIPGLNFLSSLAVAACLTPTDPILAAAVVGGKWADKHVPAHIRHLLAAESGCNDGAAFPFLYISLYLTLDVTARVAVRDWFLLLWLYQIVFGTVIGVLLGFGFRHLVQFCQRHDLIDRHSYVAQYVSLAMLTIGVCTLLGADDLLASFACGTAFAWDGFFNRQTEESVFSSVIDLLFNVAAFVYVGAWMPFNKFQDAALTLTVWRLLVVAILVLLLRRLPIMVLLYKWIPDMKSFREALFSGHFGPIGIGAVFISTLAAQILEDANSNGRLNDHGRFLAQAIQPIVAFMVLCSIVIHGLSIPSFSLGRRVHSVSRTWSRHAPPDWTNQARLVERGADIVINRDTVMEEGKLTPNEKLDGSTKRPSLESNAVTLDKSAADENASAAADGEEIQLDSRREVPPDGTESVMEWQEPHRKIVERRGGPGEDVQVEVREEDDPELVRRRSGGSLGNIKDKMKDVGGHIAADIKKVEDAITHDGDAPQKSQKVEQVDDVWASDDSNDDAQPGSSSCSGARKREGRIKPAGLRLGVFGPMRKTRRVSLRRTHSQPVTFIERPPSDEDERGRDEGPPTSAPLEGHHHHHHHHHRGVPWHKRDSSSPRSALGEGSPRHQRIENIRALSGVGTRDISPSRSVRFMDEEESGRPGSASRSSAAGDDEVESTARSMRVGVDGGGVSVGVRNGVNAGGNNVRS